jgi:hypothetical protein
VELELQKAGLAHHRLSPVLVPVLVDEGADVLPPANMILASSAVIELKKKFEQITVQ